MKQDYREYHFTGKEIVKYLIQSILLCGTLDYLFYQNKWLMIGDTAEHAYKGTFNGNGYTVYFLDAEISEENPDVRYAGLFGVVDCVTISNVKLSGEVQNNYAAYKTEGK